MAIGCLAPQPSNTLLTVITLYQSSHLILRPRVIVSVHEHRHQQQHMSTSGFRRHSFCMQVVTNQCTCPCCLQEELCRIEGPLPYRELKGEGSFRQQTLEHWEYHQGREDSPIQDIFGGQLQSVLQCPHCGHRSVSHTSFLDLSVPLPQSTPARDCSLEVHSYPCICNDDR